MWWAILLSLWLLGDGTVACTVTVTVGPTIAVASDDCSYVIKWSYVKPILLLKGRDTVVIFRLPGDDGVFTYSWTWTYGWFNDTMVPVYAMHTEV